jgi:hypothetical protein
MFVNPGFALWDWQFANAANAIMFRIELFALSRSKRLSFLQLNRCV